MTDVGISGTENSLCRNKKIFPPTKIPLTCDLRSKTVSHLWWSMGDALQVLSCRATMTNQLQTNSAEIDALFPEKHYMETDEETEGSCLAKERCLCTLIPHWDYNVKEFQIFFSCGIKATHLSQVTWGHSSFFTLQKFLLSELCETPLSLRTRKQFLNHV